MKNIIQKIIYQSIETQELLLPIGVDHSLGDNAPLFGNSGPLDSITLVALIIDVEAGIERELGHSIILASEKAMSAKRSPFATVGTLTTFIEETLAEGINA
jgi:acyl carrier protein